MKDSFLFEGSNVDIIRSSGPLLGKSFISKGSSSEIYDGGNSIFRLSTDGASHTFVVLAAKQGLSVPQCLNDWGRVMPSVSIPSSISTGLLNLRSYMSSSAARRRLKKSRTGWVRSSSLRR